MGNYNPRQITQMRWRDVKELEKFKFISGEFNFTSDEVIENASKDPLYGKIANLFKQDETHGQPLLIFDTYLYEMYIGSRSDDLTLRINSISGNFTTVVDMTYNNLEDKLEIFYVVDENLTKDNVKTLFGNKSIIGQGNIDLYMHYLSLTTPSGNYYFQFISSNNLKVDSLQDLTTLINPTGNINLYITCTDTHYNTFGQLRYSNNVWNITGDSSISGATGGNVSAVTDVVKTI